MDNRFDTSSKMKINVWLYFYPEFYRVAWTINALLSSSYPKCYPCSENNDMNIQMFAFPPNRCVPLVMLT